VFIKTSSYILSVAIAVLLLCGAAVAADTFVKQNSAATGGTSGLANASSRPALSLLDLSRFHMSQSYTLSYTSGSGQGQMIGMYINQIDYEFAKPLRMSFAIAYLHQPQGLVGARTQASGNKLLPSFRLQWEPSKNFSFILNYETRSPYQQYYNSPMYYEQSFRRTNSIFDNR
jgi:hypothetical protein